MKRSSLARTLAALMISTTALIAASCDSQDSPTAPSAMPIAAGTAAANAGDAAGTTNPAADAPQNPAGLTELGNTGTRSARYYTGSLNPATVCKPKHQGGDGVPVHSSLSLNPGTAERKGDSTQIEVRVSYSGDLRLRGYCIQLTGIDPDQGYAWASRWTFQSTSSRTRTFRATEMSQWQHAVSARAVVAHSYSGHTFLFRTQSVAGYLQGRRDGVDQNIDLQ